MGGIYGDGIGGAYTYQDRVRDERERKILKLEERIANLERRLKWWQAKARKLAAKGKRK